MSILIYTACLGLLCLVLEVINLRRYLVPAVLAGLAGIFVLNITSAGAAGPVTIGGLDVSHMLELNAYSTAFSGLSIFATFLLVGIAGHYYRKEENQMSDYLAIFIFILTGALVLFSFTNMVMLFLGIEIVSISLYILAGSRKHDVRSNEAGFKYFLMGSFATGILLFGMALVFGASGSFEMDQIAAFAATGGATSLLFQVGLIMMVTALCFKVAAVPFHFWSPDVYEGSPVLITALMATLAKVTFFAAFYKLLADGVLPVFEQIDTLLMIIASATMIVGNLVALQQTSFKRLLAYSGIANAGYMMLALLSVSTDASEALFFYGTTYVLATLGAFAAAIPVFHQTGRETIDAFDGLGKKNPVLAAMLTLSMLSIAGIPPMAGFLGKYYLFSKTIESGHITVTVIAILTSVIAIAYYFKVILAIYTKPSNEQPVSPPPAYWMVLAVSVITGLGFGLFPNLLMKLI